MVAVLNWSWGNLTDPILFYPIWSYSIPFDPSRTNKRGRGSSRERIAQRGRERGRGTHPIQSNPIQSNSIQSNPIWRAHSRPWMARCGLGWSAATADLAASECWTPAWQCERKNMKKISWKILRIEDELMCGRDSFVRFTNYINCNLITDIYNDVLVVRLTPIGILHHWWLVHL